MVGPESRGFIFGVPVAYAMGKGFVPVRKPGKLPCEVISKSYDLEYGSNVLEMHRDALKPGDRVVVVDDLIGMGWCERNCGESCRQNTCCRCDSDPFPKR